MSSRGVRTVSWKRRATSVASGASGLGRALATRQGRHLGADCGHGETSFRLVRRRRGARRSAEVDVVERRLPSGDRAGAEVGALDERRSPRQRCARAPARSGSSRPRMRRRRRFRGPAATSRAAPASPSTRSSTSSRPRPRDERRRRVERDDRSRVDDRDAVAQALRLVEVVRRRAGSSCSSRSRRPPITLERARRGCADRARRSARRGRARAGSGQRALARSRAGGARRRCRLRRVDRAARRCRASRRARRCARRRRAAPRPRDARGCRGCAGR